MVESVTPGSALVDAVTATPATTAPVAGVLLPLLVGLLTTRGWPAPARGLMLAVAAFALAAGTVAIQRAQADAGAVLGPVPWGPIVYTAFNTWLAAQTAHSSIWRKTRLLARLQAVGTRRPPHGERGAVATIERAQRPSAPHRPDRATPARAPSEREAVRPRPPPTTGGVTPAARAEQRVRITRAPDEDPPTLQDR